MPIKIKFHKDHLLGWKLAQPWPLYRIQLKQTEQKPSVTCVFCQKAKHKFPIFCRQLQKMDPRHISYIMRKHGIKCNMCLDTNHTTKDCEQVKSGKMKKCHITSNGVKCNQYHCIFLHEKSQSNSTRHNTTIQCFITNRSLYDDMLKRLIRSN